LSQAAPPTAAPPVEEPYVGLTHFTEEHVDRFFGRDTECSLIIGNLRAARLTLLYAESGVGKSSVLRAGVVARLRGFAERDRQRRGSLRLVPVVFSSWSERPVAALIHAISEAIRPYLADEDLPELPEDDLEAALEAASGALDATLLVVLDQFEEYFLYPDDELEGSRIAAQIARCIDRPDLRANFLISIREDSYARLGDLFRGKVKNVYGNFLHLDFLGRDGAREAIERPLERLNELQPGSAPFSVEPALVDAVLDQVGREGSAAGEDGQGNGAEPDERIETTYLQLVMRRLWEEETGAGSRVLRLQTLQRLGGAQAIIGSHLDRAMASGADGGAGLSEDQRRIAAAIFRFLVTSGGTKIALTAKDLSDLSDLSAAEIDPVLQHLSSPGLHILRPVVFEDGEREPRFEIFHDALAGPIVEWRARVEEEERDARAKRERAEKESAQRAAVEAESKALRERQRKRLALALLGLAIAVLLGGAVYFAAEQKSLADERDADNQSVRAAERISELARAPTFGPTAAALASLEAYRLSPTSEARDESLAELQLNPGMPRIAAGHTRSVGAVAFWPGSDKLASGGDDGTVRLWDPSGRELGAPLVVGFHAVDGIAVSKPAADGTRIVAAALDSGRVELWKVSDAGRVLLRSHIVATGFGELWGVAFDPRVPDMLAVGGTEGRVTLWSLKDPAHPIGRGAKRASGEIFDLAFAAGGGTLLVADLERGEAFKVSRSGFEASPPVRKAGAAITVATASNGSYAFGIGGRVELWDAVRHRRLQLHLLGQVEALAFARGGSVLVAGGGDWNVTTWDVASGRLFGPPRSANRSAVEDVATSPDGRTIAAAGADRLVKLWPLRPARDLATTVGSLSPSEAGGGLAEIYDLAEGAGDRVAAAAGPAGTSIWSLRKLTDTDAVPRPLARIKGSSYAVAYLGNVLVTGRRDSFVVEGTGAACRARPVDPCWLAAPRRPFSEAPVEGLALWRDGRRLLLASDGSQRGEGVIDFWDLTNAVRGGKVVRLAARRIKSEISNLAFNPARSLIAAATEDGKLRVWDVSDPADPEGIVINHARGNENQPVGAVAFSPDGALLASGGADQQVVFWRVTGHGSGPVTVDATAGTLLQGQSILSIAFSPDGRTLAAGDGEGSTCLYEVANRHVIGDRSCLLGYNTNLLDEGGMEIVRFAKRPDGGTTLLTAGSAQPIVAWNSILWNLGKGDRVDQAVSGAVCALAGRNLTEYEWNSIFTSTKLAGDRHPTCPQYAPR
jgi:WD40 repeat protein